MGAVFCMCLQNLLSNCFAAWQDDGEPYQGQNCCFMGLWLNLIGFSTAKSHALPWELSTETPRLENFEILQMISMLNCICFLFFEYLWYKLVWSLTCSSFQEMRGLMRFANPTTPGVLLSGKSLTFGETKWLYGFS